MIRYKYTEQALALIAKGLNLTPTRGTRLSAGMDLKVCAAEPVVILPYDTVKVSTGVHVWLGGAKDYSESGWRGNLDVPTQAAGFLFPRSSTNFKLKNTIGVLDCDYQDDLFAKVYNDNEDSITLIPGERFVQLVIVPVIMDTWHLVSEFSETTDRSGGDGSTGKF